MSETPLHVAAWGCVVIANIWLALGNQGVGMIWIILALLSLLGMIFFSEKGGKKR